MSDRWFPSWSEAFYSQIDEELSARHDERQLVFFSIFYFSVLLMFFGGFIWEMLR
jgi:hypothetical protein